MVSRNKSICLFCIQLYHCGFKTGLSFHHFKNARTVCCTRWLSSTSSGSSTVPDLTVDYEPEKIRNFSIIAHVDHGKSTLADRLLEYTGAIEKSAGNKQVLDKLQVERERGITVKAQTATMMYTHSGVTYQLNLVDTPGHVDFSYEVSRSLRACQGALLLVDAKQGVQAQTVANFFLAFEQDLCVVPVMNKVDIQGADLTATADQMRSLFEIESDTILKVSAKQGTGIRELLGAIVTRIPPPSGSRTAPLRALIFDSWFEKFTGVVAMVSVVDGRLSRGDRVVLGQSRDRVHVVDHVGIMSPHPTPVHALYAGQVGYVVAGLKRVQEAQVGDTFLGEGSEAAPLDGFAPARPMVYAGVYPLEPGHYDDLKDAVNKLSLNDPSIALQPVSSPALGQGWRLGFLGLLHMDVFSTRLQQEHQADVVLTAPSVTFKALVKESGAKHQDQVREVLIQQPADFPSGPQVVSYQEPYVSATVITPDTYLSKVTALILSRRGKQKDAKYVDQTRLLVQARLPLAEVVVDFFDSLKAASKGYASLDFEDDGYDEADLVKMDFLLNSKTVEELAMVVPRITCRRMAKEICLRLKETIPQQLFKVSIQAAIGGKVVAREDIRAIRKDVLAKCYGGDITRKMKLLRHQAEGKKKMRLVGQVEVPRDAFVRVLRR